MSLKNQILMIFATCPIDQADAALQRLYIEKIKEHIARAKNPDAKEAIEKLLKEIES